MFGPLFIPNAYRWTLSTGRSLEANAYFFVTDAGNVVVDPLPWDEFAYREIERFGGVARVVLMSAARRDDATTTAERYGAPVIDAPQHREPLFAGAIAVRLADQRRPNEFAVSLAGHRTAIVGDCVIGSPAGALSMPPAQEYADPVRGALGLRRILRENPDALLVGSGQSIFAGAYGALYRMLYERAGAEVLRINVDELDFVDERDENETQPAQYRCMDAEVGFAIGAQKLGYRVSTLEPGQRFCPLHGHAREEELFVVLEGRPSVRTLSGTIRCRKGDLVALPVGESGTHQLLNESDAPATVLLLARTEDVDACYYPDSDKLLVDTPAPLAAGRASLMVRGSPQLDYFDGEA